MVTAVRCSHKSIRPMRTVVSQDLYRIMQNLIMSAVIRKRRYWPKHVPGPAIEAHFGSMKIGETDSIKGQLDGIPYDLFVMKDVDYTMKLMSTYGALIEDPKSEEKLRSVEGKTVSFRSHTALSSGSGRIFSPLSMKAICDLHSPRFFHADTGNTIINVRTRLFRRGVTHKFASHLLLVLFCKAGKDVMAGKFMDF